LKFGRANSTGTTSIAVAVGAACLIASLHYVFRGPNVGQRPACCREQPPRCFR